MTSVRISGARVAAWLVLGLAALVVLPLPPAAAHATLIDSDPKDGATVQTLPDQVRLEFSEEVGSPAFVDVTAADGTEVADGDPQVLGATVEAPLTADGPAGTYTIAYRVVSADGHPISGELTFDVTTGSAGSAVGSTDAPSPAAATTDDDDEGFFSSHVEHFAVAGVGLIAGGLLVGMGLRARR
jgi:methionine-rich copper-binding protein CopC